MPPLRRIIDTLRGKNPAPSVKATSEPPVLPLPTPTRPRVEDFKIGVVGGNGGKKSRLCDRFVTGHTPLESYDPCYEPAYRKGLEIDGRPCCVEVMAWSSRSTSDLLDSMFLRDMDGFLIVYNVSRRDGFDEVEGFHRRILNAKQKHQEGGDQQQKQEKKEEGETPIMIVGHCIAMSWDGKVLSREVEPQEGCDLAGKLDCGFIEAESAGEGIHVDEAFVEVATFLKRRRDAVRNPAAKTANRVGKKR